MFTTSWVSVDTKYRKRVSLRRLNRSFATTSAHSSIKRTAACAPERVF